MNLTLKTIGFMNYIEGKGVRSNLKDDWLIRNLTQVDAHRSRADRHQGNELNKFVRHVWSKTKQRYWIQIYSLSSKQHD